MSVRTLTKLEPIVDRAYRARVAALAPAIEAALGPEVLANRVSSADPARPSIRLEPWRPARRRFQRLLLERARSARAVVMADVRACYPSIEPGVVAVGLLRLGCDRAVVRDLVLLLESLRAEGVAGLPVGPQPSAVVANGVLAHADVALRVAGFAHLRWVDDVIVFADAGEAQHALAVLRFALANVGLELAERKTRVLLGLDAIDASVPRYLPSALPPAVTLRGDADPLPRDSRAHPVLAQDGGVDLGRRPPRRAHGDR